MANSRGHDVTNSVSVFVEIKIAVVGKVLLLVFQNGTDYGFLVRQNSELLRAIDELEKTCTTLREENGLLVRLKITESWFLSLE